MGELRTRKRGKKWEYSFEGAKIGGKRKPISKGGFRTKAEAISAGTVAKAEYEQTGRSFKPSEISLADYMDYWFKNYVAQELSYNSQRDYDSKIRIHIKPGLGIYRLSALEPDAIQRWINEKKNSGLSKSMVKNLLTCLSGALDYAIYPCNYIKINPCTHVRMPKMEVDKSRKEYIEFVLSNEQFENIIERFGPDTNFYLPLMAGYSLGTRIGESYGIDLLRDVDFENHTISINHQLQKQNKIWCLKSPKYNSVRTLRMDKKFEKILKETILTRKKNMLRYGEYYVKTYITPDNAITQATANINVPYTEIMPFSVRENGELLTQESFQYCTRVVKQELGIADFHSHCLRHTHGTLLAENGAFPVTVMERLGHKDIKVTLNSYVFNTERMQDDSVEIFTKATN